MLSVSPAPSSLLTAPASAAALLSQLSSEAIRLREMLAQLKRHDDELYAAQNGTAAELRQLRTSLAAAFNLSQFSRDVPCRSSSR